MIWTRLKQLSPYRQHLLAVGILMVSTLMSVGLLAIRWIAFGHLFYGYMVWDLFLAWVPFWISVAIYILHLRGSHNRRLLLSLGAAWLLFYPNAPYLLTEFVHLNRSHDGPWWCDLVVVIGFAWNGLMLGLVSLYCVHEVVRARQGERRGWWMAAIVLGLGSFGISLGRFERFNSWDILHHPLRLTAGILDQFIHPANYPKSLATAVLLCGFLSLAYLVLWTLVTLKDDHRGPQEKWKRSERTPRGNDVNPSTNSKSPSCFHPPEVLTQ
jgi:uncharacterized membrane protein